MLQFARDALKETLQIVAGDTRFIWRMPDRDCPVVGLTFDDGPDPEFTPRVLEVLAKHNVSAMFFLIGSKVESYGRLANEIASMGHMIAGHSYSHRTMTEMSVPEMIDELDRTRRIIHDATGLDSVWFRPPRGKFNWSLLRTAWQRGYGMVHWSVTYSDYKKDGASNLIERIRSRPPTKRDIVLLHDNNPFSIEALDILIEQGTSNGLRFEGKRLGTSSD
jgi:peptidoglycan/xylan/chitin deacetylase (PgdA/CDA1 family)